MFAKVLKCLVLLLTIILPCQAFWWRSRSTEAPPPSAPIMKQIPLTYFRTYTYQQPLTSSPIQLPFLSSSDYITNYNALSQTPYFNPMMPVMPMNVPTSNEIPIEPRPVKSYGNFNVVRSLGPLPAATTITPKTTKMTTTTTTTTTTTPAPTTTTTTTEQPTTLQMESSTSSAMPALISTDSGETTFPAFNRKAFTNHFNINYNRPVYPYPEYSVYNLNSPNNIEKNQATSNVEFVPCLCPVNMQNSGFSSGPSNSIFLAQARTSVETEASLDMPVDHLPLKVDETAGTETSNLVDDLKTIKLNEEKDAIIADQNTLT